MLLRNNAINPKHDAIKTNARIYAVISVLNIMNFAFETFNNKSKNININVFNNVFLDKLCVVNDMTVDEILLCIHFN
jgi:hypothetical protein